MNPKQTEKAKNKMLKLLGRGLFHISVLERKITGRKNFNVIMDDARLTKDKLIKTIHQAQDAGSKAERYIEKNPKKAVALAAGIGMVAGGLWSALSGKKPVPVNKKTSVRRSTSNSRPKKA